MMKSAYERRERMFVGAFLFAMCLSLAQAIHSAWFTAGELRAHAAAVAGPAVPKPAVLYAPDAYRVAMPATIAFLQRTFHVVDRTAINAALDFCFVLTALYLLYALTVQGLGELTKTRLVAVGVFLALLQFPISWVVPWQRPETLPTALYVALGLYCVARRGMWFAVLLVATVLQAMVRSDVPIIFGVAMVLVSLAYGAGSRILAALKYALVALVAGGVQAYLQFVRFPHLGYPPDTELLQWRNNLHLHYLSVLVIALLPFVAMGFLMLYKRPKLREVDAAAIAVALLYLPLWFAVGSFAEMRIFVPVLFPLCMVAGRVVGECVHGIEGEMGSA